MHDRKSDPPGRLFLIYQRPNGEICTHHSEIEYSESEWIAYIRTTFASWPRREFPIYIALVREVCDLTHMENLVLGKANG